MAIRIKRSGNYPVNKIIFSEYNEYLLAYVVETVESRDIFFEMSTVRLLREQSVTYAGVKRGNRTVVAFCDHVHGDDLLSEKELMSVVLCYLDGKFTTSVIDFRE